MFDICKSIIGNTIDFSQETCLIVLNIFFPSPDPCYFLLGCRYAKKNFSWWFRAEKNWLSQSQDGRTYHRSGNTKGGSITVLLTSCLTGLD